MQQLIKKLFLTTPPALASYNNLHNSTNIQLIKNHYRDKKIIYGIQNNINNKCYIGSTAFSFMQIRDHLLRNNSNILILFYITLLKNMVSIILLSIFLILLNFQKAFNTCRKEKFSFAFKTKLLKYVSS